MVKLQIGASTFICDTAEEAVRIHRLIGAGGIAPAATTGNGSHAAAKSRPRGEGQAQVFLKKLTPHVGKELSSDDMAKIVGANGANGLGPKMHQLRRVLSEESVVLDDFVVRNKPDAASPTTWKIVKAA